MAGRAINQDEQDALDRFGQQVAGGGLGDWMSAVEQIGFLFKQEWDTPPLASATAAVLGAHAVPAAAAPGQTAGLLAGLDQPRNLQITLTLGGGSQFGASTGVTVHGTDWSDQPLSEFFNFSGLATASVIVGANAFKTVTSYDDPAREQAGDSYIIGTGNKLGLARPLFNPFILDALSGDTEPLTTREPRSSSPAITPAHAITDNSGGVDPGNNTIAVVTLPTFTWDGATVFPTAAQGTAINAALTALKAAVAQLAAKMNTNSAALVASESTGSVLVANASLLAGNTWQPANLPDGSRMYRLITVDERD